MLTIERRILKSLQNETHHLPDNATEQDNRFVLNATSIVMAALIAAEEPMNKSQRFYDQATRTIDDLRAFILHRHKERWSSQSMYPYDKHRLNRHIKQA
jgi:hypothetical protein